MIGEIELEQFESVFNDIKRRLLSSQTWDANMSAESLKIVSSWLKQVVDYNVSGGKNLRGLLVVATFKSFVDKDKMTKEHEYLVHVFGWIAEILQAASLVADDVMDGSETRRGKTCWYKKAHVGMSAVNDTFLLENLAFRVLQTYFENTPYYRPLYDILQNIALKTIFGQSLDVHTEMSENLLESYTPERYETIVRYKTSYYTFYLPVITGMILSNKADDAALLAKIETITLLIGHYFQVQDDYLDCFGDVKMTGKVGTDIQDNKCSWLFVEAVQKCDPEQLAVLLENYGVQKDRNNGNNGKEQGDDSEEKVKEVYNKVDLQKTFKRYEKKMIKKIRLHVSQLAEAKELKPLFYMLLEKMYNRNK